MPNNSGIFSLSNYYDKDLSGDIPEKSRESYREYGYFGGGVVISPTATTRSTVDRIDYSNDTTTASVRGPLSSARYGLAATGNSSFGYFGGGVAIPGPALITTVDRINYSNDNATALVRGPLSLARILTATGTSNFGYFSGSIHPIYYSNIDRIDYSNDLPTSLIRLFLSVPNGYNAATGNSNFGYFGGGYTPSVSPRTNSIVTRINYSNDTQRPLTRSPLSSARYGLAATGNSSFGYFGGGVVIPGPVLISTVDRIDYSNDTQTASVRGPLSLARRYLTATGNSSFGYFGGGSTGPFSTVDRIDYSNDTQTASVRGPLSLARHYFAATSSASFGGSPISQYGVFAKPFGYFGGGVNPSVPATYSTIDRIDYSSDTSAASVRSALSFSVRTNAATGNSNFGYFSGGNSGGSYISSTVRLDYVNDANALVTRSPLSSARAYLSATGNSNFGYFGGGYNLAFSPRPQSTVDRLNYSNDTSTLSVRGTLSAIKYSTLSAGTFNFGYFAGGGFPTISTIDRINYSNDTTTASARNTLLTAKSAGSATGNNNFGYFGGGYFPPSTNISTIERLNYSNDTSTLVSSSTLTIGLRYLSAAGNSSFGYWGGGFDGSATRSIVHRLDYANDSATATIRGSLSIGRSALSASSPTAFGGATDFTPTSTFFNIQSMRIIEDTTNASVKKRALGSFGWLAGGTTSPGPDTSIINRIDFSNDTQLSVTRSQLTYTNSGMGGLSTNNFGYYMGGTSITAMDRIDYSNDTSGANRRFNFSSPSRYFGTCGNNNYGYMGPGDSSFFGGSNIARIDYSNDTGASLRSYRRSGYAYSGTGNNNFGYFAGGYIIGSGGRTFVDRINYSNDDTKTLLRGPLAAYADYNAATGNLNFGYVAGGRSILTVNRIDYSNDTAAASVRGPLSIGRGDLGATGTSNFGYFCGGFNVGTSTVDRIDYSNDTTQSSPRGPLNIPKRFFGASTNARNS